MEYGMFRDIVSIVISGGTGGSAVFFLGKYILTKALEANDKRHQDTEASIKALTSLVAGVLNKEEGNAIINRINELERSQNKTNRDMLDRLDSFREVQAKTEITILNEIKNLCISNIENFAELGDKYVKRSDVEGIIQQKIMEHCSKCRNQTRV